jgi:hypothetical protein
MLSRAAAATFRPALARRAFGAWHGPPAANLVPIVIEQTVRASYTAMLARGSRGLVRAEASARMISSPGCSGSVSSCFTAR